MPRGQIMHHALKFRYFIINLWVTCQFDQVYTAVQKSFQFDQKKFPIWPNACLFDLVYAAVFQLFPI